MYCLYIQGKIFGIAVYTAVQIIAKVVIDNGVTSLGLLRRGKAFANSMKNRTFPSVEGRCQFNTEGNRESVYAVIAVTDKIDSIQVNIYRRNFSCLFPLPVLCDLL